MILRFVGLAALWVGLYGEATPANIAGGLAIAGIVLFATRERESQHVRIRPLSAIALLAFMFVNLVRSSLRTKAHVQVARLQSGSPTVAAVVANLITVTPGTMTIEVSDDAREIHVHVLGEVSAVSFGASVADLERRVVAAFPPVVSS
jgi:multicomponent Na+:H+ antiporter subunit E